MRIELQRLLALGNCLFNWPAKTYALHRLVLTMTRCRIERTSLELLCNGSFVSSLRTCRCTRALYCRYVRRRLSFGMLLKSRFA